MDPDTFAAIRVEAAPEKSLDNALQADAGSEIMKHLGKMEAEISDNSKSLSNIRQAVEVVEANTKVEAPPEKSLDKALQADAGREFMKNLGKMEAAISDNSKSLSNIRQAVEVVEANTKVEAVPEKSLDKALQADAGSEIMKNLGKMEAAISDTSKSLSNIRQAVEANTKDEAVPAILKRELQADAGSDLLKNLAKTINDISKKQLAMEEKIKSLESRMITCQVGELNFGLVFRDEPSTAIPMKLKGFKKTPKMVAAVKQFNLRPGGTGAYVSGTAQSPTSAEIKVSAYGGNANVMATYVVCGN